MEYDRLTELKQFDESKLGVKGLLDTGITTIPRFFHHPPDNNLKKNTTTDNNLKNNKNSTNTKLTIPIINLSDQKSTIVDQIKNSISTYGFFQIVNHNIPVPVIDGLINSMKVFFEESSEYKMRYYHREIGKGAAYSTNFDLFRSKAASWRDSLQVRMSPMEPNWEAVPEMCREALVEWDKAAVVLADELMSILCEGLGIKSDRLNELTCLEGRVSVAHYYPPCPQPELTMGLTPHTDPGVLTMVVQNEVGGLLQVKCGDEWADVEAVPGAIVVNIGDLLQMMSNDEYKSAQHRVLANPAEGARVSIATFFNPSIRDKLYGPFPELVSTTKPAVYREFMYEDYMRRFFTKELDGKTLTNFYKVDNTKA